MVCRVYVPYHVNYRDDSRGLDVGFAPATLPYREAIAGASSIMGG